MGCQCWGSAGLGSCVRQRPLLSVVRDRDSYSVGYSPPVRLGSNSEALMAPPGGRGRRGSRTPAVPSPGSSSIWRARASIRLSPSLIPMARSRPDSCRTTSEIWPRSPERSRSTFSLYLRLQLVGPSSASGRDGLLTVSMIPCCPAGKQPGPSVSQCTTYCLGESLGF